MLISVIKGKINLSRKSYFLKKYGVLNLNDCCWLANGQVGSFLFSRLTGRWLLVLHAYTPDKPLLWHLPCSSQGTRRNFYQSPIFRAVTARTNEAMVFILASVSRVLVQMEIIEMAFRAFVVHCFPKEVWERRDCGLDVWKCNLFFFSSLVSLVTLLNSEMHFQCVCLKSWSTVQSVRAARCSEMSGAIIVPLHFRFSWEMKAPIPRGGVWDTSLLPSTKLICASVSSSLLPLSYWNSRFPSFASLQR